MTDAGRTAAPAGTERFVERAAAIGRRLAAQAEWSGGRCTWTVWRGDRQERGTSVPATAGDGVYQGAGGIALFLAELFARTGDSAIRPALEGALRHVRAEVGALPPPSFSFHAGRTGAAWVMAAAARALGRDGYLADAEALLRAVPGTEDEDRGARDVIGGGAGAIPVLLALSSVLPRELTADVAVKLGDGLIGAARREPGGWSWGASPWMVRNLAGLAHGASGHAHALLELWRFTGDGRYLYAAEQATAYEASVFDAAAGNWPDFRFNELGVFLQDGREDELGALLREGRGPTFRPGNMVAWCHGAAGVGLARIHAWSVLRRAPLLADARAAVRATAASLDGLYSWCLCHGVAGNCETLLQASRLLGDREAGALAERRADAGWERHEAAGRPWPGGIPGMLADPSLLIGDAGIGYFFLRLADPSLPSVLLPTFAPPPPADAGPMDGDRIDRDRTDRDGPDRTGLDRGPVDRGPVDRGDAGRSTLDRSDRDVVEDAGYAALRDEDLERWFGRTFRVLRSPERERVSRAAARAPREGRSAAAAAHDAIADDLIPSAEAERRERLEDAFGMERARWEVARSIDDLTAPVLERVRNDPRPEPEWEREAVRLSPRVRVVQRHWPWSAAADEPEPAFFLVFRAGNEVEEIAVQPLAAVVLDAAAEPGALDELVRRAETAAGIPPERRDRFRELVLAQLRHAWSVGTIERSPA